MSNASPHTRRAFADAVRALAAAHRAMSDGDAGAPPSAPPSATPPPDVRPPGLSAVTRSGPPPRATESVAGLAERADAAEADAGDDTERFMTAALVKRRIDAALSALVDGAPDALDTLNKLAAALGDDASFASSLTQTLAAKADSAHHHDGEYATPSHEHSDYAASNHNHDGRYYTEREADRRFARQVNAGRDRRGIVQLDDIATLRAAMDATPATYDRAVSTRALALLVASESRRGLAERASTAEADAGDDTERFMTAALVKRRIDAAAGSGIPTGTIFDYAGAGDPPGWLPCDGRALSRTTYAALFAAIGTTWGAGDGRTTFNVPDLRRRVTVGSGGQGTSALGASVGDTGGAESHQLTEPEMPRHTHPARIAYSAEHTHNAGTLKTATNGEHKHRLPARRAVGWGERKPQSYTSWAYWYAPTSLELANAARAGVAGSHAHNVQGRTGAAGSHTHGVGIDNTGAGHAHPNLPPSAVVTKIIKT